MTRFAAFHEARCRAVGWLFAFGASRLGFSVASSTRGSRQPPEPTSPGYAARSTAAPARATIGAQVARAAVSSENVGYAGAPGSWW